WAIGTYPIGQEKNEIELKLFLPINPNERDPEIQAIFEKDEYFSSMLVKNNEHAVIQTQVTDYIWGKDLIFVIDQMEIIKNDIYVYANDISYIDIPLTKKKIFDDKSLKEISSPTKSIRSKVLYVHQIITGELEKTSENKSLQSLNFNGLIDEQYTGNSQLLKCVKTEEPYEVTKELSNNKDSELTDINDEFVEIDRELEIDTK
ncbi:10855_t:CDS:2, partial [Scutellospora calospora]